MAALTVVQWSHPQLGAGEDDQWLGTIAGVDGLRAGLRIENQRHGFWWVEARTDQNDPTKWVRVDEGHVWAMPQALGSGLHEAEESLLKLFQEVMHRAATSKGGSS